MPPRKKIKLDFDIFEGHKTWIHLPVEMRALCYGFMDDKSRINMSSTCKAERWNFWLKTRTVEYLRVDIYTKRNPAWKARAACQVKVKYADMKKPVHRYFNNYDVGRKVDMTIGVILKALIVGKIKLFVWNEPHLSEVPPYLELAIEKCSNFHIENFWSFSAHQNMTAYFLENCSKLERVYLGGSSPRSEPFQRVLAAPKLATVKYIESNMWLVGKSEKSDWEFVKFLIEKDVEIGTRFVSKREFQFAKPDFEDRIVEEKPGELLMKTDNDEKLILVRDAGHVVFDVISATNPVINPDLSRWVLEEEE